MNNFDDDDLFVKKKENKTKKNNNNNNSNNDDSGVKKIEKSGFDYYKVLGVEKDTPIGDIKKKYRKLLAKYHPDKFKDLPEKERTMKAKQFQLVQMAGKVLADEDAKKSYDLEQKTIKSKNFQLQKNSFEEFIKLQESGISDETKRKALLDFDSENKKLNKLRGFDPNKMKDKLDRNLLAKEIDDLRARRDMDFIELSQRNLFEGKQFSATEFNKIFEKNKKKQDKIEKRKQEKGELVKVGEEFTAFNDNGLGNYISIDADYSNMFGEDNFKENNLYGKMKDVIDSDDLSDISYEDDDEDDDDMYNNHIDKDTKKTEESLKRMMLERESFDGNLKNKDTAGYKDVMHDQFGISRQFGKIIGNDISQKQKTHKIDSDMVKIYNKMISHDVYDSD